LDTTLKKSSRVCRYHFKNEDIKDTWVSGQGFSKYTISLKRPKLRDNAVPIHTEPPEIVELSPDMIIESDTIEIEDDPPESSDVTSSKSPETSTVISHIQSDHCYNLIDNKSKPQLSDHCYNLTKDESEPQKNVTRSPPKNNLSNKTLPPPPPPPKKPKIFCYDLTDEDSEPQKNETPVVKNVSKEVLPPSKSTKLYEIKPFQEIVNNINTLSIPSRWHRDFSRANTKMVIAFHKLGTYKENYVRFIEKQLILTEDFQLLLYVYNKKIETSDIGYTSDMQIKTCEDLEKVIVKFDKVQICYGSMPCRTNDLESYGYQSVELFGTWRHIKCCIILPEDFTRRRNICEWCKRLCYTIKQRRLRDKNNKSPRVSYTPSQRKHIQEIKKVKKLLQKKCTRAAKRIDYLQNSLNSIKKQMKDMSKSKPENKLFHNTSSMVFDS